MAKTADRKTETNRAAIYARVSDKSQDAKDKTSISEQISDMEAHCEHRGLTIVERYQEVGKGWSKRRPEFQRMLADARRELFDTIVCWKSDRLSLEAVMDAIDMKTFGLMAAVGKRLLRDARWSVDHGFKWSPVTGYDNGRLVQSDGEKLPDDEMPEPDRLPSYEDMRTWLGVAGTLATPSSAGCLGRETGPWRI